MNTFRTIGTHDLDAFGIELSANAPLRVMRKRFDSNGLPAERDLHFELEVGAVIKGRVRRFSEVGHADCGPGDLWFCGMWETHGFEVIEAPCEFVMAIAWPPLLAGPLFPEAPGVDLLTPFIANSVSATPEQSERRKRTIALLQDMECLGASDADRDAARMRLRFFELLLLWLPDAGDQPRARRTATIGISHLLPAIELVFNSRRLVTNDEAANACGMRRDPFIRHFQRLLGVSFAKFGLRRRVRGAAEELLHSRRTLRTVAQQWGFTDDSHLHRQFLKHFGKSPADYRRLGRHAH